MQPDTRLMAMGPGQAWPDESRAAAPEPAPNEPLGTTSVGLGHAAGPPAPAEPATVGIRELARNVSGVVAEVARSGRPVIVTKHGAPFAAIVPIESREDTVLARAVQHLEELADDDLREGRTRSPTEVFAELGRLAEALARAASETDD